MTVKERGGLIIKRDPLFDRVAFYYAGNHTKAARGFRELLEAPDLWSKDELWELHEKMHP